VPKGEEDWIVFRRPFLREESHMTIISRKAGLAAAAAAGFMAMAGAASAQSNTCPSNALNVTESMQCVCPATHLTGGVWGTGTYTADSDICTAARHLGVIGQEGGLIQVLLSGGQQSYSGSEQNGITTWDWGSYDRSFTVASVSTDTPCTTMPPNVLVHNCSCPDAPYSGSAWGSGPYTNDSNICAAAMHSGVISSRGGPVRVLAVPGLDSYRGSEWNGVTTMDFGPWSGSISFDRN
jgi:hypothetical protein